MKLKHTHLAALAAITLAGSASAALTVGDIISVNFAGTGFGATPTGAAVIGATGDTWNDIRGAAGSSLSGTVALNEVDGSVSGVSVGVSAGFFNGSMSDGSNLDVFESDIYIDQTGSWGPTGPSTITLTGLGAGTIVDLYVYGAPGHAIGQDGQFVFGATTKTTSDATTIEISYVENVNYVKFATLVADGSGTITGTWTDIGGQGSTLNGLQLQVIPEPSAALLGGLGMLCILRRRRA